MPRGSADGRGRRARLGEGTDHGTHDDDAPRRAGETARPLWPTHYRRPCPARLVHAATALVAQSFALLQEINARGTAILVVEQNARRALSIAHRGYVRQTGRIVLHDTAARLLENDHLRRAYLGR